jgi:hypothetical protein
MDSGFAGGSVRLAPGDERLGSHPRRAIGREPRQVRVRSEQRVRQRNGALEPVGRDTTTAMNPTLHHRQEPSALGHRRRRRRRLSNHRRRRARAGDVAIEVRVGCAHPWLRVDGNGRAGRTVDHSLVLVDGPIDAAGLYVPMTRGRHAAPWVDEPAIDHLASQLEPISGDGIDLGPARCLAYRRSGTRAELSPDAAGVFRPTDASLRR